MKRLEIARKLTDETFYVHEKNLRARNCHRKFIKNLLPEKRKENKTCKPNNCNLNRDWKRHGIFVLLYATNTKQDLER